MFRIAVDAMGGDRAPEAIVAGCLQALEKDKELSIVLCGPAQTLGALIAAHPDAGRIELLDAPDVITNHDVPTMAIRRKTESSLVKALEALKSGQAQAMFSAGSTGAVLAGGIFRVGRIKGIERPALAPMLPTLQGKPALLIDCGANVDCKPAYLCDFALMGSVYLQQVHKVASPAVALANIGAEAEKGNELAKETYGLLSAMKTIRFVGNIEGRDLLSGQADVLVCDGFDGNLILKHTEGVAGMLTDMMKQEFTADLRSKLGALLLKPALRRFKKRMDYTEYGGAPLLGVKGVIIKGHGSSNARAVVSAIAQAKRVYEGKVVDLISASIEQLTEG